MSTEGRSGSGGRGRGVRASQWETEGRWKAEVGIVTGVSSANYVGRASLLLPKWGQSAGLSRAHIGLLTVRLHPTDKRSVHKQIPPRPKNWSGLRPFVTFPDALIFIVIHCEPSSQTPTWRTTSCRLSVTYNSVQSFKDEAICKYLYVQCSLIVYRFAYFFPSRPSDTSGVEDENGALVGWHRRRETEVFRAKTSVSATLSTTNLTQTFTGPVPPWDARGWSCEPRPRQVHVYTAREVYTYINT